MRLFYDGMAVEVSADVWWESLSPNQKKKYLDLHPKSKYHGKKPVTKAVQKKIQKKKPRKPFDIGKEPVEKREEAYKAIQDKFDDHKVLNDVRDKLDQEVTEESWGGIKKIRNTAKAIRDALKDGDKRKTAKAIGKVLFHAGAVAVIGGVSLGLGFPADLALPMLFTSVSQGMRDSKNDLELINNFRQAVLKKAKEKPTPEEIDDALVQDDKPDEGEEPKQDKPK